MNGMDDMQPLRGSFSALKSKSTENSVATWTAVEIMIFLHRDTARDMYPARDGVCGCVFW